MKLNSKAIETLSVNAVTDSILSSGYLAPYIAEGDKEPFWDGGVYIYNSENHSNKTFIGRLPVQVKGQVCDDHSQKEISYPIKTSDLQAFLGDGGGIYFVVYIGHHGHRKKVYYLEMAPMRIRVILGSAKGQKTKSIKLKEFPTNAKKIATIFMNCRENCQRQASFAYAPLYSLDELLSKGLLESVTIPLSGVGIKEDPDAALFCSDMYLYANVKGCAIPQPLEILPHHIHTCEEVNAIITIDGRLFYTKIQIIKQAEQTQYVFGQSFTITATQNRVGIKMNYQNIDDVRVIAKDLDFILSYIDAGHFEFNGTAIPFEHENADFSNFNVQRQKTILSYTKKATQVLDALNCNKPLLMSSLKEEDWKNILRLHSALIEKQPISGLKNDLPFICNMSVGNLNFLIALHQISDNSDTYQIEDFFAAEVIASYTGKNGERLPVSPYIALKSNDLIKASNVKWELLLPSFRSVDKHSETFEKANSFLLVLLDAYDKCGNKEILNTAKDFAEWISTAPESEMPKTVTVLNQLQVTKRMRELNAEERTLLHNIVVDRETPTIAMVGAYLLLDQQELAEIYFNRIPQDEQTEFMSMPIFHFWAKKEGAGNQQSENTAPT